MKELIGEYEAKIKKLGKELSELRDAQNKQMRLLVRINTYRSVVFDLKRLSEQRKEVDNVTQEPKNVVSDFLTEMAEKHDEELSEVIVGFQYGNLSVQRYSEGESPQWKTLEEIKL